MNSASQTAGLETQTKTFALWPTRVLGPPPGAKEINLVCWGLFIAFLLVPLCVVRWTQMKHGAGGATQLRSDFVYLYGDGQIARAYPAPRIYDYNLQQQTFNAIYPHREGKYGPSPYPPFVALFFKPFTYLSFRSAYFLWLGISLALYLTGIVAIARAVFPGERQKFSVFLCFALSFFPFLFGTLFNGQLATVAFCMVALAIYEESRGNPFRSGLALALLIYKLTLLPLLLPMLLLTRRYRTLLGFSTGSGIILLATTAVTGLQVWPAYVHLLRRFGAVASVSGPWRVQLWGHLDLNTCFAAIPGGRSTLGFAILAALIVVPAIALALLLWKSARANRPAQWLAWASTLTWTLLLNLYVPVYDSVLVVIAIILTLGALRDLRWSTAAEWTTLVAIITFAVSWVTESVAKAHGIQLLTIMLLILGTMQLLFLYRAEYRRPASQID